LPRRRLARPRSPPHVPAVPGRHRRGHRSERQDARALPHLERRFEGEPVKIGLFVPLANPFSTPEFITTMAKEAEDRGFNSLWVAEHVVLFDDYASKYPYAADGKIPAGGESGILEPFNALAFMAAVTSRIRLG